MVKVSHKDYDAALADVSQLLAVLIYWNINIGPWFKNH